MKLDTVLMDLDGSTMSRGGDLPAELERLIRHNPRVRWVLVTGRSYASASKVPHAAVVSQDIPHVFDGGATVMSMSRTLVLQEATLAQSDTQDALSALNPDAVQYVYASTGARGEGLCWHAPEASVPRLAAGHFTSSLDQFRKWLREVPVTKLTVSSDGGIARLPGLCYRRNGPIVDVTAAGVDKAFGARALIEFLQADLSRSLFIFNDENDLPVIEDPYFIDLIRVKVGPLLPTVRCHYLVACPEDVALMLRAFDLDESIHRTIR